MDAERKRIRRRVEARAAGSMRMSETSAPARCRGGKLTGSGDDALQVRESIEGFQQRVKDEVAGGWQGRGLGRRLGGGDEVLGEPLRREIRLASRRSRALGRTKEEDEVAGCIGRMDLERAEGDGRG